MAWKITWVAIRGKSRKAVFLDLHLRGTGVFVGSLDGPTCGAALKEGWYAVLAVDDQAQYCRDQNRLAAAASIGAEALVCHLHEGSMYSSAAGWCDGREVWSVAHDAGKTLQTAGGLPACFAAIRDELAVAQALHDALPQTRPVPFARSSFPPDLLQVIAQSEPGRFPPFDRAISGLMRTNYMFDAPVALCEQLTGFRHDRLTGGIGDMPFEILEGAMRPAFRRRP